MKCQNCACTFAHGIYQYHGMWCSSGCSLEAIESLMSPFDFLEKYHSPTTLYKVWQEIVKNKGKVPLATAVSLEREWKNCDDNDILTMLNLQTLAHEKQRDWENKFWDVVDYVFKNTPKRYYCIDKAPCSHRIRLAFPNPPNIGAMIDNFNLGFPVFQPNFFEPKMWSYYM